MTEGENKPLYSVIQKKTLETKTSSDSEQIQSTRIQLLLGLLPGIVLVILGSLFLMSHNGILKGEWWQYFLVGLGFVLIVESRIEYRSSTRRRAKISRLVAGVVLILGGLLFLFNPNQWWPMVIISIGVILLIIPLVKYFKSGRI